MEEGCKGKESEAEGSRSCTPLSFTILAGADAGGGH